MIQMRNTTTAAARFSDEQLAKTLSAFIGRMDQMSLRSIFDAHQECWREQANGNAGSQRSAQGKLDRVVSHGITKMLTHDKCNLSLLIVEALDP